MNLSRRTSLSLLFVTLCTAPAHAALSGDGGPGGTSIEAPAGSGEVQSIDQLLGGGNHPDLFESILQRHNNSAQPSKTVMDGLFDREGSAEPRLSFGLQGSSFDQLGSPQSPQSPPGEAPDLTRTVTVHLTGTSGSSETAPITAMSSSTASPNNPYTPQDIGTGPATFITGTVEATPVPLPAAGFLLASGLVAFPAMRRKRQE